MVSTVFMSKTAAILKHIMKTGKPPQPLKRRNKMKEYEISAVINGLQVDGEAVVGDWEGDNSIPNGIHMLPTYLNGISVYTDDGTDITNWLTKEAIKELSDGLLDYAT